MVAQDATSDMVIGQGERDLPVLRAIRSLLLLVALFAGLPSLVHAHAGHDHHHGKASPVLTGTPAGEPPSMVEAKAVQAARADVAFAPLGVKSIASSVRPMPHARPTNFAQHDAAFVQNTKEQACAGGCCCPGMSGCGMGTCCHQVMAAGALSFEQPTQPQRFAPRLYSRAPLAFILGLDRPPKA